MLKEPEAPQRTDENDTRPVSGRGDNRLLVWCLIASVFINFGFGLWMNLADVYGTERTKQALIHAPIKIYHPPPVKKKPKPKLPKPKIPPKPIKMKVQPPKPTPTPPRPTPQQHFTVGTHSTSHTAIAVEPPSVPTPPAPTEPVQQQTTTAPAPPTPQPPPVVAPPAPVHHDPPPPPPPPVHRPGYTDITSQEAEALGDYPSPDVPQDADVTTLHPCTVTWDVSESGRAVNVRVTSRSGNSDLDDSCRRAIEGMRFQPAIQDHYPQQQRMSHTWNFSG